MGSFVAGVQLAKASRDRLVLSENIQGFVLWSMGAVEGGYERSPLAFERLSWTPTLGMVQGQGSIWWNNVDNRCQKRSLSGRMGWHEAGIGMRIGEHPSMLL